MKHFILFAIGGVLLIMAGFSFTACHKDKVTETGTFMLHLHSNIDTNEIELGTAYHDANGRQIQLDKAQFFISNVHLKKADGSDYALTGAYILKTVAQEEYLVGTAPVGNYQSVTFDVGVDAAANHKDPSTAAATSPLSKSGADTWFGTTSAGYVFLNVAGLVDTSANNNGAVNFPISYKIGSDALLKTVTLPKHTDDFVMTKDQVMFIHLICDYGVLLNGVNFKTESQTSTNDAIAQKVAANIPSMFSYEE